MLDVGQGAVSVGSDQSLALDGCGFHGSGLENSKGVTAEVLVGKNRRIRWRWLNGLQALSAVGNATGAEVGDGEDCVGGHGDGAGRDGDSGEDGGGEELHFDDECENGLCVVVW